MLMMNQPLRLRDDNFTPAERTPWGGRKILERYKQHLNHDIIVGESWEVSGHPSFPSMVQKHDGSWISLPELASSDPKAFYGAHHVRGQQGQMPFLVKLLNSAPGNNLSVQVHPPTGLYPDKPSKTEAWIILDAAPGAGLYLGLKEGISAQQFEKTMRSGGDVSSLMNFVEAHPGEVYFIPSGTLHAIGAGILLLEPQESSETTFRAYDWGRTVNGKPRTLHYEETLQSTDWNALRGQALIDSLRTNPPVTTGWQPLVQVSEFQSYRLHFVDKNDVVDGSTVDTGVQGIVVLEGSVLIVADSGRECVLQAGQSAVLPAAVGHYQVTSLAANSTAVMTTAAVPDSGSRRQQAMQ